MTNMNCFDKMEIKIEINDLELVNVYVNRLVVMFYLKDYVVCLWNVELVFRFGYFTENYYKLYDR